MGNAARLVAVPVAHHAAFFRESPASASSTVTMRAKRVASTSSVRLTMSDWLNTVPSACCIGKGEGGFADEIDAPAKVGGVPRRRLAALFGADAGDDQTV